MSSSSTKRSLSKFSLTTTYLLIALFSTLFSSVLATNSTQPLTYNTQGPDTFTEQDIQIPMSTSNDYKGWHAKALENPHRSPSSFTPDKEHLAFTLLSNTPVEPEGFSLAVFKPSLPDGQKPSEGQSAVVDTMGRVLYIPQDTFTHLSGLADTISTTLPETGNFRNTWKIKHPMTSRPIDRLLVKSDGEGGLKETSVQGYAADKTELTAPVGEYAHLPEVMRQFFGLALEARDGYARADADKEVIGKVKKALGVE